MSFRVNPLKFADENGKPPKVEGNDIHCPHYANGDANHPMTGVLQFGGCALLLCDECRDAITGQILKQVIENGIAKAARFGFKL